MIDLREKLDTIIETFLNDTGLNEELIVRQFSIYECIRNELNLLLNERLKGKRVGIYGNGRMTKELFYSLGMVPGNIACIIDKNDTEALFWKLENTPIIKPNEIANASLDAILIPSKRFESEIIGALAQQKFAGEVIGLHSWLELQGIKITEEFDQYKGSWKYKCINEYYVQYIHTGEAQYLMTVIIGLLLIHDFCHGLIMLEKYQELHGYKDKRIARLKAEIERVFADVREKILLRETRHVMVYLVDSLSREALEGMPELKKIEEESFSLKKFFNQYGTTRESVMTLLTGYQILENKLYNRIYFTDEDGALLPYLKDEGYRFHYLMEGRDYAYVKLDKARMECNNNTASEVYFSGLCEMLAAGSNTFTYMHAFTEVHPPFINPLFEKKLHRYPFECTYEEFLEQYQSSQTYIDGMLWFYYKLLKSDEVTQIFMGDHGINLKDFASSQYYKFKTNRWDRRQLNPACIISDSVLGKGSNNFLIANYSFAKLLKEILQRTIKKEELEAYADEYVKLEILPVYNPEYLQELLQKGQGESILGVVGILTETDTFIHLENGEERVYINEQQIMSDAVVLDRQKKYREIMPRAVELHNILKLNRYKYHNEVIQSLYKNEILHKREG